MKKFTILALLFFALAVNGFSAEYSIADFFLINIPENLEVISINQYLSVKRDRSQYCMTNIINVVYENRLFFIIIYCFGNTNTSLLNGTENYNMQTRDGYYSNYNMADEIKFLKQNYTDSPFINENNVQLSRFVSDWASGATSDYYGLYFKLPNDEFSECVVSVYNVWGTFSKNQKLDLNDKNYRTKYEKEGGKLKDFFQLLEIMEKSISFTVSDSEIKITGGYHYEKYKTDNSFITPTIDNLRMRNTPSLKGEVTGYMANTVYRTVIIGEEAETDGIKGNWIMIRPYYGNVLSWVFSGYTRKLTEQELADYFDGVP